MDLTTQAACAPDVVPANAKLRAKYERREPETTVLWQVANGGLETFLEAAVQAYGRPLSRYVENELRRHVACGILPNDRRAAAQALPTRRAGLARRTVDRFCATVRAP